MHGLPRGLVESPSMEMSKTQPDVVLGNLLQVTLGEQEVGPGGLQGSRPVP